MPRSLRVRHNLIGTVKSAVRKSGFLSQRALAEEAQVALSTLGNFLAGKPVDLAVFQELCTKLSLDMNQVAEPVNRAASLETSPETSPELTPVAPLPTRYPPTRHQQDWGEAPDVSLFYDRVAELETLQGWVKPDRCRVIDEAG
jgi:hypothetical protein